MPRNRLLYQSEALFITSGLASGFMFNSGNSGQSTLLQFSRVQSVSHDLSITRQDIQQEGQLARIDAIITESPQVNVNTSWYITDGSNEQKAGMVVNGLVSCISGILTKEYEPKNIFILQSAEGNDAVGDTSNAGKGVISIGNTFLSNISWNASVGQIPTCTASWQAFNMKFDTGATGLSTPAINILNGVALTGINFTIPTATAGTGVSIPSAIKPGDVLVTAANGAALGLFTSGTSACPVQSVSVSIPLSRTKLNKLGSLFAYSLEPQFPVKPTVSLQLYQNDLRSSSLDQVICNDQFVNLQIQFLNPACGGTGAPAFVIQANNMKLDSQSFSNSVGSIAKTVDLSFSASIGGPQDVVNGILLSGQGRF